MNKRLIALLLALTVMVSMLAGCKENDVQTTEAPTKGTTASEEKTSGATEESTDADVEKVMEFEYFGRIANPYPESSPVYDLLMKNTGITVNFTWAAKDAWETTLSARISEKDLPDVIGNISYSSFIQTLIDDGLIISLSDLLEEKMPNYYNLLTEDDKVFLTNSMDGEIYGFGFVHGMQGYTSWSVRQDWLDKLNKDIPETWDEWLDLWRAMKATDLNGNGEADEIPVYYQGGHQSYFKNIFGLATNGTYSVVDGEYVYDPEHPNYMDFLDGMRTLYTEGLIPSDYLSVKQADMMGANRVGTFHSSVSTTPEYGKLLSETDKDAYYVCIEPVIGPKGDQLIAQRSKMTQNIWITKAAVDEGKLDAILEFFNYCYSDEGTLILNYGIENESYKMVDGKPVLLSPYTDNFTDARSYGIVPQVFAFRFLPEVFMSISNAGMKEEDMDKYTYESIRGNLIVNNDYYYAQPQKYATEASVEYEDLMNEQQTLADKYIMGQISRDDYLKEYDALKKAGLNEVIEQAKEVYKTVTGK